MIGHFCPVLGQASNNGEQRYSKRFTDSRCHRRTQREMAMVFRNASFPIIKENEGYLSVLPNTAGISWPVERSFSQIQKTENQNPETKATNQ